MKKIVSLSLLLFAPFLSANSITFSSPQQPSVTLKLEELQSLPTTSYTTDLPWIQQSSEFLGVKLSTLLTHVYGSIPEQVDIGSLNNYHSTLSRNDIVRYQPILAYQQDHHYIKVRNKGPYWVIYPLSQFPELDHNEYHAQMVWQVNEMKIKQK
ncbi:oxidoreductase [Vibrio parahaemolyticus]|uniref:oxidoreductase n=1 Tax=Vibrio parahaemolyticus TaxID=670 RepID=UPI00287B3F9E|nr:oxidoreductase [Vibrio parahaemolyticus]EJG1618822.1 oxidoreductase [Vibrio parahaemolyticus]EJG1621587.1 oxidoreductase [Vibrio parahaemolyticus]MDS1793518.1 oxidoreductase [Vibrio parahaemolyticus]MDS1940517.1 oxidoreductase [Vibrio parahaemolyticus]